ncbi:glycosyltransferase [Armatimonas sp.]|uniref:glycosyltransferase n=1 Tax=Armatimonas sp. TaxID=1872638 RepID=UPI0037506590
MRIAIVHDDLTQRGGAERVVEAMHQIWPDAPVYTSVYDPAGTFSSFAQMDVRTSFMQNIPFAARAKYSKLFLPLYPIAFETLDLRGYDVVLSHGTRFSQGVLTSPETCHIHYCHTPARFAWRYYEYVEEGQFGRLARILLPIIIHHLRQWDQLAAQRIDYFFSNSYNIARRVLKFYRRDSDILYPPIDVMRFTVVENPSSDYLLVVSRLLPYKRVDLAIEACNQLKIRLKVVGSGPDLQRLKSLAGPTVEVLGRVPDGEVEGLFANCRAFLFPGEEDFGIAPLEAMAAGRPIIAYRAGGAMETVLEGDTGLFFNEPTTASLVEAIGRLDHSTFAPERLRAHAETFSLEAFQKRLQVLVGLRLAEHRARYDQISPQPKGPL